jgi:P pilus assembly chaperone PapD
MTSIKSINKIEKDSEQNLETSAINTQWPVESEKLFKQNFKDIPDNDNHIVIVDNITQKQIGIYDNFLFKCSVI